MRGLKDFMVHIPNLYHDTFKTESGIEFYGDRRWSAKKMANTFLEVVEKPFFYDGPINKGFRIFIDPTVLFTQIYPKTGEQENIYLVDRKKGLYKIDPSLIIAFNDNKYEWVGHNENLLVSLLMEEKLKTKLLTVPNNFNSKKDRKKGVVKISNKLLSGQGVSVGDTVFFEPLMGIDVHFENEQYTWIRNRDLLALELTESA